MTPSNFSLIQQIDQLNEQAWESRLIDVSKSFSYCENALTLAKRIAYDKGIAEALRTTGFCNIRLAKYGDALKYVTEALQIFQKIGDLKGEAQIHEYFGLIYRSFGDYEHSLMSLFKALQIQQQESDREGESLTNYHIGISYKYLGNIERALEYLLESLQLAQAINYRVTESYALNHLGVIYAEMEDYANALEYYEQSLKIRRQLGDKWGEAGCLNNMGLIYSKIDEYEKGEKYCLESLALTQSISDKKGEGNSLYNLGLIHHKMGKKESACQYVNQSLQVRSDIMDKRGQIESLLLFIDLFLTENTEALETLLHKANDIGQEIRAKDLLLQINVHQYKFFKKKGQVEKALFHLETQLQLEKELYNQTINQKLTNQKINHQIEQAKKEAENIAIKAELKLLTDRQRIARDLHDEVGSTLSSISILSESYLRSGQVELDKSRFGYLGGKARTALDSISDIVWSVNPDNDSMEKLLARMCAFAYEMLENIGTELLFQVGDNLESMSLPMEKRKDFYLIFKEAINNCAKYAQAKHMQIQLELINNTLLMSIKDDGIGFDPYKVNPPGLGGNGLKNMQRRALAIGGTFSIQSHSGEGVTLRVAVPLVP